MGTTIGLRAGHGNGYYSRDRESYSREKTRAYVREPEPKWWAKWAILAIAVLLPSIGALFTDVAIVGIPCIAVSMLLLTQIKQLDAWYAMTILIPPAVTLFVGGSFMSMIAMWIILAGVAVAVMDTGSKLWDIVNSLKYYPLFITFYYLAVTNDIFTVTLVVKIVITTMLTVLTTQTIKVLILDGRIKQWLFN